MPSRTHQQALQRLEAEDVGRTRRDEPLAPHSSWRIGGPAELWVEPGSIGQLARLVRLARQADLPLIVVGAGSNILFADEGIRGVVCCIGRRMSRVEICGNRLRCQAGVAVPRLARIAQQAALAGLEYAVGIPGTLGGLICMNGGSLGGTIGESVRQVRIVTPAAEVQSVSREWCRFGYRCSAFQQGPCRIVAGAELELQPGSRRAIHARMLQILRERRAKYPRIRLLPNCGSVFKSDPAVYERFGPPGKVVEDTGCKGWRVGGAEVSPQHANFIVNRGGARAADVLELIARVGQAVERRTGFALRCEVRYASPDGQITPASQRLAVGGRQGTG
ncbi:MAG: UDP-N-acetylmuramate dehydrogenase [Planctomycetota bacterium]